MAGVGEQAFMEAITDKLPLALDDASVLSVAEPVGWSQQWLLNRRVPKQAPPSRDLSQMFKASAPVAPAAGPSPVAGHLLSVVDPGVPNLPSGPPARVNPFAPPAAANGVVPAASASSWILINFLYF